MTTLKLFVASLLLSAVSLSSNADAQTIETFTIDMNNAQFQGQNQLIRLKQRLNQAYPNVNFNNASLVQVRFFGKSRAGNGQIELLVGGSSRDRKGVPQSNGFFASNAAGTYHQVRLNPNGRTRGTWQLLLDGNIKVQRIVVRARGATPPPSTSPYVTLGTGETTLILPLVQVFNVDQRGVKALRIEASGNFMVVQSVRVRYNNGTQQTLSGLEGQLFPGQSREVPLNSAHVRRVTVTAMTIIPFGSTATYRVRARIR